MNVYKLDDNKLIINDNIFSIDGTEIRSMNNSLHEIYNGFKIRANTNDRGQ